MPQMIRSRNPRGAAVYYVTETTSGFELQALGHNKAAYLVSLDVFVSPDATISTGTYWLQVFDRKEAIVIDGVGNPPADFKWDPIFVKGPIVNSGLGATYSLNCFPVGQDGRNPGFAFDRGVVAILSAEGTQLYCPPSALEAGDAMVARYTMSLIDACSCYALLECSICGRYTCDCKGRR